MCIRAVASHILVGSSFRLEFDAISKLPGDVYILIIFRGGMRVYTEIFTQDEVV